MLLVARVRPDDGPKVAAVEFARKEGLAPGERLGASG
jgi:hypothetical protein